MYTLRLEELESRDLLSSSMSPHVFVVMRSAAPPVPIGDYSAAPLMAGGSTGALAMPETGTPASPDFGDAFAGQPSAGGISNPAPDFGVAFAGQPPPGGFSISALGPTLTDFKEFASPQRFAEPFDFWTQPGFVEIHFRALDAGTFTSQVSNAIVAAAADSADPALAPLAVRTSSPALTVTQQAADLPRTTGLANPDLTAAGVAQRLAAAPAPRLDTLVGVSAFRLDPQAAAAVHNSAWAVREPEGTSAAEAVALTTPSSSNPSPTLPRTSEAESGATEPALALPRPQGSGGVLSLLPAIDIADVERGMQHFLKQLQGVSDDLIGKRDKPGLGVWLVAGTAAVAACEMARRQMWGLRKGQSSFRSMALEMNWIAGSPPDFPLGE